MIEKLTVYMFEKKLGTLATKNKKIYFEYDADFLKTRLEISPYKLPLKNGVFSCEDDTFEGIWGVFADSMPDGWGRLLMDRHFAKKRINPSSLTPLDRLSFVGENAMGALTYKPSVVMDSKFHRVNLDELFTSSQAILKGSSEDMLEELLELGGSSGGARPKVLVQISSDKKEILYGEKSLKKGFEHFLVKFASSTDHPQIGAIEYAYSLMAKKAGIDMPKTFLLDGKKGRYFATGRFDRVGDRKVHMHSVAGLVHSDFRFPTFDYDDLLSLAMHLTKDMQEVKKAFRLAVFNLFAYNRDDHTKNFSFLMDEKGTWKFSPAYDLTFSYGVGGEHSTMYLGEGKNPTQKHLLELAKKHSIKDAKNIIEEVKESILKWKDFAKEAGVSKHIYQKLQKEFVL